MRCLMLFAIMLPAAACAQETGERELVQQVFTNLQPISIANNREYCGYIGYTAQGLLVASSPARGDEDSCEPEDPANIDVIIASYHTHGSFSHEYSNEVPSGEDLEADEAEGIDGWVATPGGRLWYVDIDEIVTSQICGLGCLPFDPNFIEGDMGHVALSYTYEELVEKLEEDS
ncbi:MAG: DUF4329 domain-containing protein [Boseongicola sp.]|nr:MAG: DUF4329 domain-containing protein [Boseongicola sp.]